MATAELQSNGANHDLTNGHINGTNGTNGVNGSINGKNGNTTKMTHRPKPERSASASSSDYAEPNPTAFNGPAPPRDQNHDEQQKENGYGKTSQLSTEELRRLEQNGKGPPGGIDATPLPSAHPGYTIRFTFKSASNLPPSDINTMSSDPFVHATLKPYQSLKRHKDDPDLVKRTHTIQKTVEPVWEDDWIVSNVPADGFTLKCRIYDEDSADRDDRLGTVIIKVENVSESALGGKDLRGWKEGRVFEARKRAISKRAYVMKALTAIVKKDVHMTPTLTVAMEVLGKSEPPYGQICTLGPNVWTKHYSPLIGRLTGTKVDRDEEGNPSAASSSSQGARPQTEEEKKTQKYDFQANQMQLQGPVPSDLYHRFVEFKPIMGNLFQSTGLRGKVLNKALHKQHSRIYNYDRTTEVGQFKACSKEASLQFLKMAHFDDGARTFTYVLTLDGLLRFTETGPEFGIDMLSKHNMHSDVQHYIACSGEFFIRRLEHADQDDHLHPNEATHPPADLPNGPPSDDPPEKPETYQLVIDNDSGTYRPDKRILPDLKAFLERQFPGLAIVAKHWEDKDLQEMKTAQREAKKKSGRMVNVVMNRSQSSISSAESELEERGDEGGGKSKREAALGAIEDPGKIKEIAGGMGKGKN